MIAEKLYLKLKAKGIIRFVHFTEISYLEADDNYTKILLSDNTSFMMCKPLVFFEKELGLYFLRCHKSYLVNISIIKLIDKRKSILVLNGGEEIPISRVKTRRIEDFFETISYGK